MARARALERQAIEAIARDLKSGLPRGAIADRHGVHRRTVSNIARRLFGPAPRGRRPVFDAERRAEARELYLAGEPADRIALAIGCSEETVRRWAIDYGWREERARRRQTPEHLEAEIARLSALVAQAGDGKKSYKLAMRLRMLQRAYDGLKRALPRPKPIPRVQQAAAVELLGRALRPEYGLLPYQRAFLLDDARYRCVLKARQIGFTWAIGLQAVLGLAAGRDQIIVSASEEQARLVIAHLRHHAQRLEVPIEEETDRTIRIAGQTATALSTNWRTAQGYTGDVWFDEFAWAPRPDQLFNAVTPSITRVGGRITVCSTPWVPGNLFWRIATNHQGRWDHFSRHRITIHDAIAQGMSVPGGLEELRLNFDAASWAMFFECQWAEEEGALLTWALLDEIAEDLVPVGRKAAAPRYGRLRLGVDLGRVHDRTVLVLVGEILDPVSLAPTGRLRLVRYKAVQGLDFAAQRALIEDWIRQHPLEQVVLDRTGLGMQLAEELSRAHPGLVVGRIFTAQLKERMALDLLRLAEQRRLSIPRDPALMAELHAVRRIATATGIRYDAPRNAAGHADAFWALALAVDGMPGFARQAMEVALW